MEDGIGALVIYDLLVAFRAHIREINLLGRGVLLGRFWFFFNQNGYAKTGGGSKGKREEAYSVWGS